MKTTLGISTAWKTVRFLCIGALLLAGVSAPVGFVGTAYAQSNMYQCKNCKHWFATPPAPCPHCGHNPYGSSGSSGGTSIPQNWGDVRRNVGVSLMNSFMQGLTSGGQADNAAAQQEAARRAAEQAAAEEAARKRREEVLRKAAESARTGWDAQDAANMAEFSMALSSKKTTGGGMSSLMRKQLEAARAAEEKAAAPFGDSNVVDLRDTPKVDSQTGGGGAAAVPFGDSNVVDLTRGDPSGAATPFGDSSVVDLSDMTVSPLIPQIPGGEDSAGLVASGGPLFSGARVASVPVVQPSLARISSPPPPARRLNPPKISKEQWEFIKDRGQGLIAAAVEVGSKIYINQRYAEGTYHRLFYTKVIDTAKNTYELAKVDFDFGKSLTNISTRMADQIMDVAREAIANPTGNWWALADRAEDIRTTGGEEMKDASDDATRSVLGTTSEGADIGEATLKANIINREDMHASGEK
ncbi:MAG: hypothetical protein WC661_07400 [Opitutaceae bacterium]|jgi:hypothetical protein